MMMKNVPHLSCRELRDFLDDYVDGTLDEARRAVFEAHLAMCEDCHHYLDSYKQTIALAREAARAALPTLEDAPEGLIKAILAACDPSSHS